MFSRKCSKPILVIVKNVNLFKKSNIILNWVLCGAMLRIFLRAFFPYQWIIPLDFIGKFYRFDLIFFVIKFVMLATNDLKKSI